MLGINEMDLNQSTMLEIVQLWLDLNWMSQNKKKVKVTHITEKMQGSVSSFRITLVTEDSK